VFSDKAYLRFVSKHVVVGAGVQDTVKTVAPSGVCSNSKTTTTTTAPSGGADTNDNKCTRSFQNNSVSAADRLLLKEVDL